jgi:hypothetical protein
MAVNIKQLDSSSCFFFSLCHAFVVMTTNVWQRIFLTHSTKNAKVKEDNFLGE